MIGDVQAGLTDVAISCITITYSRSEVIQFTKSYFCDSLRFVTKAPTAFRTITNGHMNDYARVLVVIFASVVVTTLILCLSSQYGVDFSLAFALRYSDRFFLMTQILLKQCIPHLPTGNHNAEEGSLYAKIYEAMVDFNQSDLAKVPELSNPDIAYIEPSIGLKVQINVLGRSKFHLSKETFQSDPYGIVLPLDTPHLDAFNSKIDQLRSSGIPEKWMEHWINVAANVREDETIALPHQEIKSVMFDLDSIPRCRHIGHLIPNHLSINSIFGQKFLVGSTFHDLSVLQYMDGIRGSDGGQTMGHDDCRSSTTCLWINRHPKKEIVCSGGGGGGSILASNLLGVTLETSSLDCPLENLVQKMMKRTDNVTRSRSTVSHRIWFVQRSSIELSESTFARILTFHQYDEASRISGKVLSTASHFSEEVALSRTPDPFLHFVPLRHGRPLRRRRPQKASIHARTRAVASHRDDEFDSFIPCRVGNRRSTPFHFPSAIPPYYAKKKEWERDKPNQGKPQEAYNKTQSDIMLHAEGRTTNIKRQEGFTKIDLSNGRLSCLPGAWHLLRHKHSE
ncbi:unnamed protein product, partial [Cyprideis torosa]